MLKLVELEFLKLKRCKMIYVIPIGFVTAALLFFLMYKFNPKFSSESFTHYYRDVYLLINLLVAIGVFYLFSSYIFANEYVNKTDIVIFSGPCNRTKIYFAKLITSYIFIVISLLGVFILTLVLGLFGIKKGIYGYEVLESLKSIMLMIVMYCMLIPISSFISIKTKSIVPNVIFVISICFINLIGTNVKYINLLPWCIPVTFIPNSDQRGRIGTNPYMGILSITLIFLIGMYFSIREINKKNN